MAEKYGQLPAELRRSRGKKIAAHEPGFWGFGPPEPGKGPKPIPWQGMLRTTEPDAEAVDDDAEKTTPDPVELSAIDSDTTEEHHD
jgi:hypothetical protein